MCRMNDGSAIGKLSNVQGLALPSSVNVNPMNIFILPLTYTHKQSRYQITSGSHANTCPLSENCGHRQLPVLSMYVAPWIGINDKSY